MEERGRLLFLDCCVREGESRTLRIAEPVVEALSARYDVERIRVHRLPMSHLDVAGYARRGEGDIPAWALECARKVASADRIVVAAPMWDMGLPAALKVFIENVSLFGVTFTDDGSTCRGLCRCARVLYVTTRGMGIPDGDPRDCGSAYLRAVSSLWGLGEVVVLSRFNLDYSTPAEVEGMIASAVGEGVALAGTF